MSVQRRTPPAFTPLRLFLMTNGISYRDVVKETGLNLTSVEEIVRGERHPRTDTVNKLLAFLRLYKPNLTYDEIFFTKKARAAA